MTFDLPWRLQAPQLVAALTLPDGGSWKRVRRREGAPEEGPTGGKGLKAILEAAPSVANLAAAIVLADEHGYRRAAARRLMEWADYVSSTPQTDPTIATARWVWKRCGSAQPRTVGQYLSGMLTTAKAVWPDVAPILASPMVRAYVRALSLLAGPPARHRGARPFEAKALINAIAHTPPPCGAVLALMWVRGCRAVDARRTKVGGLWRECHRRVGIELPPAKSDRLGLARAVIVTVPKELWGLLRPYLHRPQPEVPQGLRALLWPGVTHAQLAAALATRLPGATPHSVRKSAVERMMEAGVSYEDAALLTGHRTIAGLLAYTRTSSRETLERTRRASRALGMTGHTSECSDSSEETGGASSH